MKGGSAQVQTVSIIDTISELASNQGDRAKITQVRSARTSSSSPSSKYPPPPPRHPMMSMPASNFLATNINISQMSLPPHNSSAMSGTSSIPHSSMSGVSSIPHNSSAMSGTASVLQNSMSGSSSIPHNSMSSTSGSRMFSVNKAVNGRAFEEFSTGLSRSSGFLNSTMKSMETDLGERRRRKKVRNLKNGARGQGETPDWIKELFNFAKKGDLEQLVSAQCYLQLE